MPQTLGLARLVREPSSVPSDLEGLRAQIDHLDHSLLDLIEQRLSACIAIAALKANDASGTLKFRPRRETEFIGRLVGRADRDRQSTRRNSSHKCELRTPNKT